MTFRIGYQILNIEDSGDIIRTVFYWEAGLNNQTEYWIDIFARNGYKWGFFLGNVKERAMEMYEAICDKLFSDIEQIAK